MGGYEEYLSVDVLPSGFYTEEVLQCEAPIGGIMGSGI
jgi:hypothetical protein